MSTKALRSVALALIVTVLPVLAQLRFVLMSREVVEQRLQSYKGNDSRREAALKTMFESSGCRGNNLAEQAVKGLKQPNLICVLPGSADSTIVVGAHFDHVDAGDGVVDNWAGASMLPSLYQSLENQPQRRHTFLFVAFSGEDHSSMRSTRDQRRWRKRVGVGPTGDGVTRRPPVLKTGVVTGLHALPFRNINSLR
jgi:hypothetical protein